MKNLLVLFALAAIFQTTDKLKTNDLDGLTGKQWNGTLTYLDYGTGKLEPIPTELMVIAKGSGVYIWKTVYPKETSHNGIDTIKISANGKMIDDEIVLERTILSDGSLKFVTQTSGADNNRKALFHKTYLIGKKSFIKKKEVKYDGENTWFTRNTLSLKID